MKLLNLGCGATRPKHENWVNIDNLHAVFPDPTVPERIQFDGEPNYVNADLKDGLPFADGEVDGIVASHILEHLTCQEALKLIRECHRVLRTGGVLRISLPCPKKFYELTLANCQDWGEPNGTPEKSFMEFALFFNEHIQLIDINSLNCLLWVSGFKTCTEMPYKKSQLDPLASLDNRPIFSLFAEAVK